MMAAIIGQTANLALPKIIRCAPPVPRSDALSEARIAGLAVCHQLRGDLWQRLACPARPGRSDWRTADEMMVAAYRTRMGVEVQFAELAKRTSSRRVCRILRALGSAALLFTIGYGFALHMILRYLAPEGQALNAKGHPQRKLVRCEATFVAATVTNLPLGFSRAPCSVCPV
jgi:hypothetical protein